MDPDVAAVVDELDAHRERFMAFSRSLTAEQLTRPVPKSSWVVRDFIAHLGTIDGPVGGMFQGMHGVKGAGFGEAADGIDPWNDRIVAERRAWPLEQVIEEMAANRAVLHGHLAALTADDLLKSMDFGGDSKRAPTKVRFVDYLRGWNKHDPMHAVDMVRALPEVVTPDLERWFDHPAIRGYQAAMNKD